ncbi:MAG TPA: peptide deformylase [Phototrophicaceae bacterium]|jgi:peptide deformylase|nr:peptide deformylase [Phototrophicaceae bacterium]
MKKRILLYPEEEKLLRTPTQPVTRVDKKIRALVQDLKDTLATEAGVGLAAPQIGILKRVAIIRLGQKHDGDPDKDLSAPIALINPQVVEASEAEERDYDACLSIPGLYGYTYRAEKIKIAALNEDGKPFELEVSGLDARCALHEIDHLDGILFLDRIRTQDDLYIVKRDKRGKIVHVPITEVLKTVE